MTMHVVQQSGACFHYPLHLLLCAALVSRQFIDMSRVRIEGLLAAFPKLVGSGKQHTYIETENVRYVYQPLEVSVLGSSAPASPGQKCANADPLLRQHCEWSCL